MENTARPARPKLSREWIVVLTVLAAALLYKLTYLVFYAQQMPFFNYPIGDSVVYLDWARNILNGDLLSLRQPYNVFYRAPLYPYVLALFLKVFGSTLLPIYIFQMLLGTASLLLTYLIGRRLFSHRAGLAAIIPAALYAALSFKESKIVSVTIAITLMLLAAWFLLKAQDGKPRMRWFLSGLSIGIATLTWGGTIVMVPLAFGFWLLLKPRPRFALPALFMLGWFLAISPATLHNVFAGNDFVLVNSNSGYTFYQGNNPGASGTIVHPPEVYERTFNGRYPVGIAEQESFDRGYASSKLKPAKQGEKQELVKPSEASGFWLKRGLDFIKSNPSGYLKLELQKFVLMLSNLEMPSNYYETVELAEVPALRFAFVPFALLLALGIVGMAYSFREKAKQWPLYLLIGGTALTLLVFYVGSRYRLPLVLPLVVFAGAGIDRIITRAQQKKVPFGELGLLVIALVVSGVFCTVPFGKRNAFVTALGYRNLGEAYHVQARELPPAKAAYCKALGIFARYGELSRGLLGVSSLAEIHTLRGDVYMDEARFDSAAADFHAARALDARSSKPVSKLAFTFFVGSTRQFKPGTPESKLDLDSALYYAREWQRLDSTDVQPLALLGDVQMARGDTDGSFSSLLRLTNVEPRFAPAYFAMAGVYLARRDTAGAFMAYKNLIKADSANAMVHVAVGDLHLARKDTAAALVEYGTAARLDTLALEPALRMAAVNVARGEQAQVAQVLGAILRRVDANPKWRQTLLSSQAAGFYFEVQLRLGLALANTGDWPGATARAEAVLKLAPGHPTATQLLESFKAHKLPGIILWQ